MTPKNVEKPDEKRKLIVKILKTLAIFLCYKEHTVETTKHFLIYPHDIYINYTTLGKARQGKMTGNHAKINGGFFQ